MSSNQKIWYILPSLSIFYLSSGHLHMRSETWASFPLNLSQNKLENFVLFVVKWWFLINVPISSVENTRCHVEQRTMYIKNMKRVRFCIIWVPGWWSAFSKFRCDDCLYVVLKSNWNKEIFWNDSVILAPDTVLDAFIQWFCMIY